ncbi:MAG: hypothetical protein AAB544_01575 [Patescibacteria group bacterium]
MQFFLSPWFMALSTASLIVMGLELWGLLRACKRHNTSPMGILCGKSACFPTRAITLAAIGYVLLTMLYLLLPPLLHAALP